MIVLFRNLVCLALALAWLIPGQAHLLSAGVGSIQIQGDTSTLSVAVPVSLFRGVDLDGDGFLQPDEIRQGRALMIQQLQSTFRLSLGQEPGVVIDDQLMASVHLDRRQSTNQIEWRRLIQYPQHALRQPVHLSLAPSALSTSYMFQVRRFDEVEAVVFSSEYPSHTFLKSAWGTFASFVKQGFIHILTGYDHLLFLLLLLVVFVSVKRWLAVLTAFTLAHGLTYGLATFGFLFVSPSLIEPVIALTIVLIAATHLLGWRPAMIVETSVVFSLGLFHGLGFAGSMATLLKEQRYPMSSILGFNVGVEIGQVFFAILVWGTIFFLSGAGGRLGRLNLLVDWVAKLTLVVGTYWLIERIWYHI